jgi:phosphorylated CTD-interacting factor 1
MANHIQKETPIFLFNFQTREIRGVYFAVGRPSMNIEPSAWTDSGGKVRNASAFPAQVRVVEAVKLQRVKLKNGMKVRPGILLPAEMEGLLHEMGVADGHRWKLSGHDGRCIKKQREKKQQRKLENKQHLNSHKLVSTPAGKLSPATVAQDLCAFVHNEFDGELTIEHLHLFLAFDRRYAAGMGVEDSTDTSSTDTSSTGSNSTWVNSTGSGSESADGEMAVQLREFCSRHKDLLRWVPASSSHRRSRVFAVGCQQEADPERGIERGMGRHDSRPQAQQTRQAQQATQQATQQVGASSGSGSDVGTVDVGTVDVGTVDVGIPLLDEIVLPAVEVISAALHADLVQSIAAMMASSPRVCTPHCPHAHHPFRPEQTRHQTGSTHQTGSHRHRRPPLPLFSQYKLANDFLNKWMYQITACASVVPRAPSTAAMYAYLRAELMGIYRLQGVGAAEKALDSIVRMCESMRQRIDVFAAQRRLIWTRILEEKMRAMTQHTKHTKGVRRGVRRGGRQGGQAFDIGGIGGIGGDIACLLDDRTLGVSVERSALDGHVDLVWRDPLAQGVPADRPAEECDLQPLEWHCDGGYTGGSTEQGEQQGEQRGEQQGEQLAGVGHRPLKKVVSLYTSYFERLLVRYANANTNANTNVNFGINEKHAHPNAPSLRLTRLFTMVLRYETLFDTKSGDQASLPPSMCRRLQRDFGVGSECFASPLNSVCEHYCSLFVDTDKYFGSRGSFFDFTPTVGSFEVNPPFNRRSVFTVIARIVFILNSSSAPLSFCLVCPAALQEVYQQLRTFNSHRYLRWYSRAPAHQHQYLYGCQHRRTGAGLYWKSKKASFVYFLQNSAGQNTWPCEPRRTDRLLRSFTAKGGDLMAELRATVTSIS